MSFPANAFRIPRERMAFVATELSLVLYFGWLALASAVTNKPFTHFWRSLGVYSYEKPFYDLAVVVSGIETAHSGLSPYASVTRPPSFATYNYPRIWLTWGWLGLSEDTLWLWGIAVAIGFWVVSLILLRPRTLPQAAVVSGLWCSPAFMLAIERGNIDLVVFVLLALTLLVQRRSETLALGGYLLAGVAKLYPIIGLVALARGHDGWRWRRLGATGAVFAAYLWFFRADIVFILNIHPHTTDLSYGCATLFQLFGFSYPVAYGLGAAVAVGSAVVAIRFFPRLPELPEPTRVALLVGAAIYGGTYLLGTNFEYRLIFLQLCLPAIWSWSASPARATRRFARATLGLFLAASWWELIHHYVRLDSGLGRQVATFAIFVALAYAGYSAFAPSANAASPSGGEAAKLKPA